MDSKQRVKHAKRSSQKQQIMSLQEYLKEQPAAPVPECYQQLQPAAAASPVLYGTATPPLPTVDFRRLVAGDDGGYELNKLHSTCKEWGFFQLVNHGVSRSHLRKLKSEIEAFFNLPLEEKLKYTPRGGDIEGYGQTLTFSDDQKLDWGDRFYAVINPCHARKPYLLPQFPPSLRHTLEVYFSELQRLAKTLLTMMAKTLGIEEWEMEATFDDGMQSMRLTYYPPCPEADRVMGLKPHTDGSGLTILLEVNGVQGLQIKKDGVWVPVNFHPDDDAFVVNIGDILEIFSNGVYKSVEHRVTVNPEKERISIALFYNPNLEGEVGPARTLIGPQNLPLFDTVGTQQYLQSFFSRRLDCKTNLQQMMINHPTMY